MNGVIRQWGSTAEERARPYACDRHVPSGDALYRAVDVDAPPAVLWRWLCQLKVAPYSYDWLDNLGRRSPRTRDPGNEALAVGDRMMTIFRLVEVERERQMTMVIDRTRLFGDTAVTYEITPRAGGSRLVAKIVWRLQRWSPIRVIGPLGDLVMMRKQLLTLKQLAERDAAQTPPS